MKVFALITAALMASAGGAYYLHSTDSPPSKAECPVAKTGGGCAQGDAPQCCAAPCPACAGDCRGACEDCCVAGAQVSTKAARSGCCAPAPSCRDAATSAITAGATVK